MSDFVFYEMSETLRQKMKLPLLAYPVRKEKVREIFGPTEVAMAPLLDELDLFLLENPQHIQRYRETVSLLAYLAGIELGTEGFAQAAAHYLEMGLAYNPENLSLRANYAVALQALGRTDEALDQCEKVWRDPEAGISPMLAILTARLYAEKGEDQKGYRLLQEYASFFPEDEGFWNLLGELREKSNASFFQVSERTLAVPPPPKPAVLKFCPQCGMELSMVGRFCFSCGASLENFTNSSKISLETDRRRDARRALERRALLCCRCSSPLAPGKKFCTRCGYRQ